jgi:hypothetical protein
VPKCCWLYCCRNDFILFLSCRVFCLSWFFFVLDVSALTADLLDWLIGLKSNHSWLQIVPERIKTVGFLSFIDNDISATVDVIMIVSSWHGLPCFIWCHLHIRRDGYIVFTVIYLLQLIIGTSLTLFVPQWRHILASRTVSRRVNVTFTGMSRFCNRYYVTYKLRHLNSGYSYLGYVVQIKYNRRMWNTVEPGYNDVVLHDISPIASYVLWYQLIPRC